MRLLLKCIVKYMLLLDTVESKDFIALIQCSNPKAAEALPSRNTLKLITDVHSFAQNWIKQILAVSLLKKI